MMRGTRFSTWIAIVGLMSFFVPGGCVSVPTTPPVHHVWQYLEDNGEAVGGYGLYTYALVSRANRGEKHDNRYELLVQNITSSTDKAESLPDKVDIMRLNLFLVPRKGEGYNYDLSQRLLTVMSIQLGMSFSDRGPFLFSLPKPISDLDLQDSVPVLLVDLSRVHEDAFSVVVSEYKRRIVSEGLSKVEEFSSFRTTLLDIALDLRDSVYVVDIAKSAMASLMD